jgi:stage V sporulation protein G
MLAARGAYHPQAAGPQLSRLYEKAPGFPPSLEWSCAMLNLTDIRITKIEGDEKLRAFAAIVIEDCFLVGDLRVVEGDEGFFVSMPSKRKRDGSFKDIAYPLNNETREAIERQVLLAFEKATGVRAISRLETGEETTVRPDLLSVTEFGLTPKTQP